MRASRPGNDKIKWLTFRECDFAVQLFALFSPNSFEHHGKAVDDDIQKASNHQAENENNNTERQWISGNQCKGGKIQADGTGRSLDHRSQFEDRQVHGNDHATNDNTEEGHDNRFKQAAEPFNRVVHFFFVDIGNFGQHGIELT